MKMSKKIIVPGIIGLAASAGMAGSMISSLGVNAATASTSTTSTTAATTTPAQTDPTKGGHVGSNGITETLLTGDTATKAKAAAEAAVPGATVDRVENDAEDAAYEAHMTKSDGTRVTVKMDASFKVTSTEDGFGGRPRGGSGN